MGREALARRVVMDDAITRNLGDAEARMLVDWATDWAELLDDALEDEGHAELEGQRVCRKARAIGKFVALWSVGDSRGAALQLAACERFGWPMPSGNDDPADVMAGILAWENRHLALA